MAESRVEQALGLADLINQLRAKVRGVQGELERAEAEFARLLGDRATPVSAPAPSVPGSLASRVMKVLEAQPGRVFTIAEIAKAVGAGNAKQLGSTLNRLKAQRRVQNPRWGKYQVFIHELADGQRGRSVA